jgi:formylglycine-generating enzyme required for sulfatase activity
MIWWIGANEIQPEGYSMKWFQVFFFTSLLISSSTALHAFESDRGHGFEELQRMAGQGDPVAMVDLGEAYFYGKGVLKDPFMAKCWVQKAREAGLDLGDDQTARRAERLWNELKLWQYSGDCRLELPVGTGPARGDRFVEPVTGMGFVWVPGRCFSMGSAKKKGGQRVCPKGFWMGQYEVTQGQWRRIMSDNPSRFKGDTLPVEQVSYERVQEFVRRLNQATGRSFSLPTEVQWEFACTNRGRKAFAWGREQRRPQANCGGCDTGRFRGKTAPAGSFPPNALGLFDMGGNVREWCRDAGRHREDLRDRPVRGGSFVDNVKRSGCRQKDRMITGLKAYYLGFRLTITRLD